MKINKCCANAISISEVVSAYVQLKRSGRESSGLCPFHTEQTPSFSVNESKGVYNCFGCGEGGDVICFIEKIEGVDFKGALSVPGLADQLPLTRVKIKKREAVERASRNLAAWALALSERIGTQMRELGQRTYTARKILKELPEADEPLLQEVIQRDEREGQILSALDEDLLDPNRVVDLWGEKELIEQLVGTNPTYSNEEVENRYPPLTENYRKQLTTYVRGEA